MELEFMVAGPLRGDWGRDPLSGTKGRTATAGGWSGLSLAPGGKSGAWGWKVGLGGTEMRCWICCEEEPLAAGARGQAGAGGLASWRGASLRRSRERCEPYGGGCGLAAEGDEAAILESSACSETFSDVTAVKASRRSSSYTSKRIRRKHTDLFGTGSGGLSLRIRVSSLRRFQGRGRLGRRRPTAVSG